MQAIVNVFLVSGQKYQLCNLELQAEDRGNQRLHFHMKFFLMYGKILLEKYVTFFEHQLIINNSIVEDKSRSYRQWTILYMVIEHSNTVEYNL